jgi:hypothetical protein
LRKEKIKLLHSAENILLFSTAGIKTATAGNRSAVGAKA